MIQVILWTHSEDWAETLPLTNNTASQYKPTCKHTYLTQILWEILLNAIEVFSENEKGLPGYHLATELSNDKNKTDSRKPGLSNTTLKKLLTHLCLCHQSVYFGTSQWAVTIGLALHWPCITDISGSPPTDLRPRRGRWVPTYTL